MENDDPRLAEALDDLLYFLDSRYAPSQFSHDKNVNWEADKMTFRFYVKNVIAAVLDE